MITGQWQPHTNPNDIPEFLSVTDIVIDIADRALGGYCDFNDDITSYPRNIVEYYQSPDCPEPLNKRGLPTCPIRRTRTCASSHSPCNLSPNLLEGSCRGSHKEQRLD